MGTPQTDHPVLPNAETGVPHFGDASLPVYAMDGSLVLLTSSDPELMTDSEHLVEQTVRLRAFADLLSQFAGAASNPMMATMARAMGMVRGQ